MIDTPPPLSHRPPVHGNDWRALDPPDIGRWTPSRRVTVVVPCYEGQEPLAITLAALARQTYPMDLLEVVVADDGSDPPITVPPGAPFEARVVAQERAGFGLARARNTGAAAATGSILVFLDCDMVPEPDHIEAHARWHHLDDRILTLGFRNHVDFDDITPADVAGGAGIDALVGGRSVSSPQWIEFHMTRTRDLTSVDTDLFRIVTGGNLGISKAFYDHLGGSDESFTQWGAEDTELGYRAFNAGGLLVPERRALAWHQGEGAAPDAREQASQVEQRHKLAHLIAEKGFRRSLAGRTFTVPMVTVAVDAAGRTYDEVAEQVENLLASEYHDLLVGIAVPADHPEAVRIGREFGPDPRVVLSDDLLADVPHAAVRLEVPPRVRLWRTDVASMLRGLDGLGLVVAVPEVGGDGDPSESVPRVRMVANRALGRALHVGAGHPDDRQAADPWELAGELFGTRVMEGDATGLKVVKAPKSRLARPFRPVDNPPLVVLAGKVLRKVGTIRSPHDVAVVVRWGVKGTGNVARRARRRLQRRRDARRAARLEHVAMDVPAWVRVAGDPGVLPGARSFSARADGLEVVVASSDLHDRDLLVDDLSQVEADAAVPVVRLGEASGIPAAAPVNPRRFNPAGFLPVGSGAEVEPLSDLPWPEDRVRSARAALATRIERVHDLRSAARLLELTASGAVVVLDDPTGAEPPE